MMTDGWMKKCTGGGWVPYADGCMDEKWMDEEVGA
jgi:hypothetical protein